MADDAKTGPLDGVRAMLLAFVPEAGQPIVFRSVDGTEYRAIPECSARTHTRLMEAMQRRTVDLSWLQEWYTERGAGPAILAAITDPTVMATIEEAFAILHPGPTRDACARASGPPVSVNGVPVEALAAGDVFSAEQMLRAVVPFFAAPVLGILQQISPALVALAPAEAGVSR